MVYINDVHILFYVLFAFIGGFIGQVIDYLNIAFLNERKVISKETFKKYKETFKVNYKLIVVNSCLYVALLYKFGMNLFSKVCNTCTNACFSIHCWL